jgi:hypothetical protein
MGTHPKVNMIIFSCTDEGVLVSTADKAIVELLRSRIQCAVTHDGVLIGPPMVLEKTLRADQVLRRRGRKTVLPKEVFVQDALVTCMQFVGGEIQAEQVIPALTGLERAVWRSWQETSDRLAIAVVLDKCRGRARQIGDFVIMPKRELDAMERRLESLRRKVCEP